jgi:hypothetical protein
VSTLIKLHPSSHLTGLAASRRTLRCSSSPVGEGPLTLPVPFGAPRPYGPQPILLTSSSFHCLESVHPIDCVHRLDKKPSYLSLTHPDLANQGREESAGGAGDDERPAFTLKDTYHFDCNRYYSI